MKKLPALIQLEYSTSQVSFSRIFNLNKPEDCTHLIRTLKWVTFESIPVQLSTSITSNLPEKGIKNDARAESN